MTNFFEFQRLARKKSNAVLLVFGFLLLALLFIYNFFIYYGVLNIYNSDLNPVSGSYFILHGEPFKYQVIALAIFVLGFVGTYFYQLSQYRSNPLAIVFELSGRHLYSNNPKLTPKEKQLSNIVEEMCIAAGIPVVPIYILPEETSINAFTAGHNLKTGYIAVTEGALEKLSRDEMQAVVAHEVGHIVSADVSVNSVLICCIAALTFLMTVGLRAMESMGRSRSSKKDGQGAIYLLALLLIVIGYFGALSGRMLQSMFSRKREYLADSLGVQFSRNPSALASALAKIRDFYSGYIAKAKAMNIAHMCIASPVHAGFFSNLWASHPPINSRIALLDSKYLDAEYSKQKAISEEKANKASEKSKEKLKLQNEIIKDAVLKNTIDPKSLINGVLVGGPIISEALGQEKMAELKALGLDQKLHDILDFKYCIWALFISKDFEVQKKQLVLLKSMYPDYFDHNVLMTTLQDLKKTHEISASVLSVALPMLKTLKKDQKDLFFESLSKLAAADGMMCPFEMIAMASLKVSCEKNQTKGQINHLAIKKIIYLFANLNQTSQEIKKVSYHKALQLYYGPLYQKQDSYEGLNFTFDELVSLIFKIQNSSLKFKQLLSKAILVSLRTDENFTTDEIEAFRIFSMAIGIPSPPLNLS